VRFTYHAKNGLRKVHGTREEAESVVRNPIGKDLDPDGKPRYLGYVAGQLCRIIVALDEPDTIVSIHERRHL
jgi:hypothetical protein